MWPTAREAASDPQRFARIGEPSSDRDDGASCNTLGMGVDDGLHMHTKTAELELADDPPCIEQLYLLYRSGPPKSSMCVQTERLLLMLCMTLDLSSHTVTVHLFAHLLFCFLCQVDALCSAQNFSLCQNPTPFPFLYPCFVIAGLDLERRVELGTVPALFGMLDLKVMLS